MKEYRIMAYFTKVYPPRSYKRKIFYDKAEAEKFWHEAIEYYSNYKYLDRVVIENRSVTDWKEG